MDKSYKDITPSSNGAAKSIYKNARYQAIYNSQALSLLSKFNTNCMTGKFDAITESVAYNIDDLEVTITNDEVQEKKVSALFIAFTPNTAKVLDVMSLVLARKISPHNLGKDVAPEIQLTIDEYLTLCDKPITKSNRDAARKIIIKALQTFYVTSLSFKEKKKERGKPRTFIDLRLCTSKGIIDNNLVVLRFTPEFAQYIVSSYITYYDTKILQLGSNNQNAYPLYRKMLTHYGMDSNIKRGSNNMLSVRTALESCPDIPQYETIKETDRHYYRIQESLSRALECIEDVTNMRWYYCTSDGKELDDSISIIPYQDFINLYIKFELEGFPDQTERIKAKEKAQKKKEQARKRAEEKKKKSTEQNP